MAADCRGSEIFSLHEFAAQWISLRSIHAAKERGKSQNRIQRSHMQAGVICQKKMNARKSGIKIVFNIFIEITKSRKREIESEAISQALAGYYSHIFIIFASASLVTLNCFVFLETLKCSRVLSCLVLGRADCLTQEPSPFDRPNHRFAHLRQAITAAKQRHVLLACAAGDNAVTITTIK